MEKPSPTSDFQNAAPKDLAPSDDQQFQTFRNRWAHDHVERLQGKLLSLFETDDEMRLSQHFLLMAIFAFFVMFILWANFAALNEVTRGEGKVIPSTDVQSVQTLEAGIVDEFLVK